MIWFYRDLSPPLSPSASSGQAGEGEVETLMFYNNISIKFDR